MEPVAPVIRMSLVEAIRLVGRVKTRSGFSRSARLLPRGFPLLQYGKEAQGTRIIRDDRQQHIQRAVAGLRHRGVRLQGIRFSPRRAGNGPGVERCRGVRGLPMPARLANRSEPDRRDASSHREESGLGRLVRLHAAPCPFHAHLRLAPQPEAPKAQHFFDDPKHRLHGLLESSYRPRCRCPRGSV